MIDKQLSYYKLIRRNRQMQTIYKSPIKTTAKLSTHSIYNTRQKPNDSGVSACKREGQIKREVFNNQAYKNILSKMLSKNSLEDFLEETSKFIILTDSFSKPYQKGHYFTKNSQEFPELGRAMLKDGSFIRHYCKLLIMKEPHREEQFKKYFYERYKNEICEKKAYFDTYFKVQIKEDSITLSQSQRKVSSKKEYIEFSWKKSGKSSKKIPSQSCSKPHPQQVSEQQPFEVSPKFYEQTQSQIHTSSTMFELQNEKFKPLTALHNVQQQCSQSMKYSSYCYRSTGKKKNETQQQRDRRLMGLVDVSAKSKKSQKSVANIVRFVDELESNQRLKEIYESVKKEKEERKQLLSSQEKTKEDRTPIVRQTYHNMQKQWEKTKIYPLTPEVLSKLTPQQKKLLEFYPNIKKYASFEFATKDSPVITGIFEGKVLIKCFVADLFQYLQPSYIAVYLTESQNNKDKVAVFDYQEDPSPQIILVKQQKKEESN